MKIITVLGARPQFIKAATVSRAFAKKKITEVIVHTGQHFDENMSDVFFREMEIPKPDYFLEINSLSHGAMTGRMMERIEEVLLKEKPDWTLVYGDTNSTLAGALAASKIHVPVAHVEAGLRSFDMKMPEEINRILTDRVSRILFCPTQTAVDNLQREGFHQFGCRIEQPGDVMLDAVMFYRKKATGTALLSQLGVSKNQFVLATLHRAENTNDPNRLRSILNALNEINREMPVVLPLHPRTKNFIQSLDISLAVKTIPPVGYFDMLSLIDNCRLVMTDSGGLQKEAYFFNKYCLTLRDQTEWVELVEAQANKIVGADTEKIMSAFHENKVTQITAQSLYGQGDAAEKIADSLLS
ncbi:MAG: UDP-N-acetylglucosamine 2-epimerase (non-hydrolyzing) [Cyclobacteriaceae bacterium]|nr:UDP-N-acetylglucosamine 2-epimerase (non-hydrolyzing) [Cyclobacteriaceae bacterium]